MKAFSLHVGLNQVDPFAYGGWGGELAGCHNDADYMFGIATSNNYNYCQMLLDADATAQKFTDALKNLANLAESGDLVLITYSGHGGQVRDRNGDEPDGLDETLVLYDRMLVDDEFNTLLARFRKGVRIAVVSDSCHSGSVTKLALQLEQSALIGPMRRAKAAPAEACRVSAAEMEKFLSFKKPRVKASVILLSACADNQLAYDGNANGLFTGTLAGVRSEYFNDSSMNYKRMRNLVSIRMPPEQTPRISYLGARNKAFENQIPFKP